MTFKTVEALFNVKYPKGSIWKENTYNMVNVFNVCYTTNGKVYVYRVCNLTELSIRLKLIKSEPIHIIEEKPLDIEKFNKNEFGLKI